MRIPAVSGYKVGAQVACPLVCVIKLVQKRCERREGIALLFV